MCKEEELRMESAKDYKTPLKRRVRETLEDDDAKEYNKFDLDDKLTLDKAQELFYKIDKALKVNHRTSIKNLKIVKLRSKIIFTKFRMLRSSKAVY